MPFQNPERFTVRRVDSTHWKLTNYPLLYRGRTQVFLVPIGYVTDFATVPWFLQWFVPRTGVWTLAAVLHDWLITHGIPMGLVSSRDADGIFRRVLREEGVDPVRQWLMWAAVRVAAPFNEGRRPAGLLQDAPQLALVLSPFIVAITSLVLWLVG